jgi:hypothetical protein
VAKGLEVGKDLPSADLANDKAAQAMLFNQRAR